MNNLLSKRNSGSRGPRDPGLVGEGPGKGSGGTNDGSGGGGNHFRNLLLGGIWRTRKMSTEIKECFP